MMGQKEEKASGQSSPRYVWDPKKLAWVDAAEPVQETAGRVEAAKVEPIEQTVQESVVEGGQETTAEEVIDEAVAGAEAEEGQYYTGVLPRLGAFIIDFLLLTGLEWLIAQLVGRSYFIWYVIAAVYFIGFWLWRGQTIGKLIIRARIVKTDGSRISLTNALLRYIGFAAYFAIFSLGTRYVAAIAVYLILLVLIIIIGFNTQKRGIHDLIAGTCVVSTRTTFLQPEEDQPSEESEQEQDGQS